jgi:membrane protein implicated in regulation of membrane protease activity
VPGWAIWAIVAVGLAVGEIFTPGAFFLGPVALAAVAALIVALAGAGAVVQ